MEADEIPRPPKSSRDKYGIKMFLAEGERIEQAYRKHSASSFMCFVRGLIIESATGPRILETCIAPFQKEALEDIAPCLEAVQRGEMPPRRRFWWERTKKASKDADLGLVILWLIAFANRPRYFQVGAANKDQAAIVKQRIEHLLHWNEWLNDYVEVVQWEIRSKARGRDGTPLAKLHIMSSDISGAHGGIPDVLIINELSHVNKWEFAENLMDNADGVAQGVVIIATNAGFRGTKAEVWRHNAMRSSDWSVHILAEPAPWHDKKTIEDAKSRNPRSRFLRLWWGIWASGKGDALNEEDIDACFCLPGPLVAPDTGWEYIAGLDLGVSHDHCGFVVVGINAALQKIRLAYMRGFEPREVEGGDSEINLQDVEDCCLGISRLFRTMCLFYDPYQAKLMAQRLSRRGVRTKEMYFTTTNLTKMATSLLQVVQEKKLECFDVDGRLRRDFGKFNIVEKQYGFRLEATSDEFGHADVGTALVICLPVAVEMLRGSWSFSGDESFVDVASKDLTKEEIESLPPSLLDIYNSEVEEEKLIKREKAWGKSDLGFLDDIE